MNALETARQTWQILDLLPVGALVLRQDLVVMFWNTCLEEWTGYTRHTLLNNAIHLVFPLFKQPHYSHCLQQVFETSTPTLVSSQLHQALIPAPGPTGARRLHHTTVTPIQLNGRSERYALLTIQDVTDCTPSLHDYQTVHQQLVEASQAQERLEAQLYQSHKLEAIGTLAGGIAHDFNNMLSAILGFTELALHDVPRDNPAQLYLQQVLTAGQRARDLVQQILTFCHQQQPQRQPIQLQVLVQEVLTLLRASLPATIAIQSQIDPCAGPIMADPTQMHQVLVNLCTNAGHAMHARGGTLTVSLTAVQVDAGLAAVHPTLHPGPHVRLTVQDTGHGIPPEIQAHIFEPFFTTKAAGEGTGMGLAMVHSIVLNHGGTITADSRPGQGSTFTVYMPCSQQVVHTVADAEEIIPAGHHERILFVDDEAVLTHLAKAMLERLGYETIVRSSSDEALETFRATPQQFDLIITDNATKHMTGEMLVRELRRIRPDIPVIVCTDFNTMTSEKARLLGIDALLHKPLVSRDLGLAIHHVLARRVAA